MAAWENAVENVLVNCVSSALRPFISLHSHSFSTAVVFSGAAVPCRSRRGLLHVLGC